jgi:NCAIR mutase (PurE)-related protein
VAQLEALVGHALAAQERRLFTRLERDKHDALDAASRAALDFDPVSRTAFLGERTAPRRGACVAVVTGGSSDVPVSREAARTLEYYGEACLHVPDVGVAGLWRLMKRIDEIRAMRVVIVVAGMEGALPSVVAGLVPGVVIALPTSVGYGVAEGGHVALHSALASCAPGLLTVNIDNGYGAACAALRVLGATA